MKNLFDPAENAAIVARISNLTPRAERVWGKMNAAQALAHLQTPLRVAFGDLRLKRSIPGLLFGSIAKKKLTSPEPWKRNLPTDKAFIVADERDFATEQARLLELVRRFGGARSIVAASHPFFGSLTPEEWGVLMWKHLDHHLTQFGV
jgi:hypothetical protein